jgi:Zn-finger nucleic acid-binding protein
MFAGSRFCPRCGAAAAREEIEGGDALPCPRCRSEMRPVRVGALVLHECPDCGGAWMAGEAFERMCGDREQQAGVRSYIFALTRAEGAPAIDTVRYVPCPTCGRIMNRMNFARRSGIILDVCKPHGVGLYHGELGRLAAFIDGGGLAVARERDREQARLAEEERRARETQPSPVHPGPERHARTVFERRAFENLAALGRLQRRGRAVPYVVDGLATVILRLVRLLVVLLFGR